jgi:FMN phosphatase YigB (HAD superfamily)
MTRAGATAARTMYIGDRVERDGLAASRAGARCMIRSRKPIYGWSTFERFNSPVFSPFLTWE